MAYIFKTLASGTISAGSSGDNTVYTVPASTKALIKAFTIYKADTGDKANVKLDSLLMFNDLNSTVAMLVPAGKKQPTGQTNKEEGTVENHVLETGKTIKIDKTGIAGAVYYFISGAEIT